MRVYVYMYVLVRDAQVEEARLREDAQLRDLDDVRMEVQALER